jgi:murein DD-endopeptidase MepM/ murein hydrolase activator NlpD
MMPTERDHHMTKDKSFWIVVIPRGETGSTRSYKASVLTIVLVCVSAVVLIAGLTVALIIYTPAGLLIPMSDEQLQKRYGSTLSDVQQRLNRVSSEVLVLREYNNKLRNALGQPVIPADSVMEFSSSSVPASENTEHITKESSFEPTQQEVKAVYRSAAAIKEEISFHPSFPIIAPAAGYVSRTFETEQGHNGIDYAGKIGSLIVAAADGNVVFSGYSVDDGYTIILSHGDGYLTMYKHNQALLKRIGDVVRRGEAIALLGNSGRTSYGPHLHFEVWKDGKACNPNEYLLSSEL